MSQEQTQTPNGARRIVLRIVSGARANQLVEIPIDDLGEVVFGRDPDVAVKFDPDRDDLVSRRHARITWQSAAATTFQLEDLASSNGTLHNGTRISDPVSLRPGDSIQLGAGGPKVTFDLDPRPEAPPATRLAAAAMPPPTRQAAAVRPPPPVTAAEHRGAEHRPAVGRETVERMVAGTERQSRRQAQILGLAVALLAVVAAVLFYLSRRDTQQQVGKAEEKIAAMTAAQPMSPADVADLYSFSTVLVETAWTLVHTGTGEEVYHRHIDGKPAYIRLPDGSIEPWLWHDDEKGTNDKIRAAVAGSGFVVTQDGFILTNRHVAAGWRSPYTLQLPGRIYDFSPEQGLVRSKRELKEADRYLIQSWIPSKAKFYGELPTNKQVDGRHIYLDVTFPKNTLRIPARVVRESDVHDVALMKIETPNPLNQVELYDNYDSVRAGDSVTVLGYPAVSPESEILFASLDAVDRTAERRQVPDPTLSYGPIGRVHRGTAVPVGTEQFEFWSGAGDVYQLTIDTAGAGNSGGPVFDDHGRVIGIYTYGRTVEEVTVSFAVPIRYGQELMGIAPILR